MTSSLYVIRGRPGRWEGVAVDSPIAVAGDSFDQVRRCLTDMTPSLALLSSDEATLGAVASRAWRGLRRMEVLARHFASDLGRRAGLTSSAHESHLLRFAA
ncbi:hypothetical protein [Terrarubrum flagellatum]|uniref:hypothetical protein n=1 Tax=Terrirubrum flagellatum TaxID=2895980 RepID=UPI003145313A